MLKRTLPLLIGLTACGLAFGHATPAVSSSTTITTTTTSTWRSAPPSDALSESAIKTAIANAGFKEVKGLKFKDGVWRTKGRGGNEQWVDLSVGPVNGRVYVSDAPSKLNADRSRRTSPLPAIAMSTTSSTSTACGVPMRRLPPARTSTCWSTRPTAAWWHTATTKRPWLSRRRFPRPGSR